MNTLNNILDKVEEALNKLYEKDQYLIHSEKNNHVSERSITHKLGAYLTPLFEEYDVDCEYNRFGYEGKFVEKLKQNVIPDIIIHKRGKRNNFIAIEVKTWWNKSKVSADKDKLTELTKSKYNYEYGISLVINKSRDKVFKVIFSKGKELKI
jgi:hypothetical protein